MTEAELEKLIFDTAHHHLAYGKGTSEELRNPYSGTNEENDHQTTIWATVRREVENEWIHSFGFPETLVEALWESVESQIGFELGMTTSYPQIHPALGNWCDPTQSDGTN